MIRTGNATCTRALRLTVLASALCCAAAAARGQYFSPDGTPQDAARHQAVVTLTRQINVCQTQSAVLALQIAALSQAYPAAAAVPSMQPSAEPMSAGAASRAVDDAKAECDALKQTLLAGVHGSVAYKQASADLESARADLARAHGAGASATSPKDIAALAEKVRAGQARVATLDRQALDASADWQSANARLRLAQERFAAARAAALKRSPMSVLQTRAGGGTVAAVAPPTVQQVRDQIRDFDAQRAQADAQAQDLLAKLGGLSPADAEIAMQEGEGIREEQAQLWQWGHKQISLPRTAAGAPLVSFSSKIPPRVQRILQDALDDLYKPPPPAPIDLMPKSDLQKYLEEQDAADRQKKEQE